MNDNQQAAEPNVNVQTFGRMQWTEADLVPNYEASGIFATAQNPNGGRARELTPDTRVTVGRVQMPIRAAVAAGLIRQDADGNYREVSQVETEAEAKKQAEEDRKAYDENHFSAPDRETESFLMDLDEAFREARIDPMTAAAAYLTGSAESQLKAVALAEGIPLGTLQQNIDATYERYKAQADNFLSSMGLDPEQVWEFERETVDRHKSIGGYLRHLQTGDKSYYRALAEQFMNSGRYQPKLPDGVTMKKTEGGREYVSIPGHPPMSLANARRLKLI